MSENTSESRAVIGGSIGMVLEWYEYSLYAYFASITAPQFFPNYDTLASLMLTFAVFGVGFIMRPFGGVLFGIYGDNHGRKAALTLSIVIMGIATFLMGCIPTYEKIGVLAPILMLVLRLAQGVAAGGEAGSAATFLGETGSPHNRAYIMSFTTSSVAFGLLGGTLTGLLISLILPEDSVYAWGWRIPFLTGILVAWFGIWIRKTLSETDVFLAEQDSEEKNTISFRELFKEYKKELVIVMGTITGITVNHYILFTYLTTYITSVKKMPLSTGFAVNVILLAIYLAFVPPMSKLADKIGRKKSLVFSTAIMIVLMYPLFSLFSHMTTVWSMVLCMAIFMPFQSLNSCAAMAAFVEVFPTKYRCSGFGISYNLAISIFGGMAPFIATWLIRATSNPISPVFYVIPCLFITFFTVVFLYKETAGIEL